VQRQAVPVPVAAACDKRKVSFFDKCRIYDEPDRLIAAGVFPYFRVIESAQDPEVRFQGRSLVMLGSNNYLGLTNHPKVKEAATQAIARYGSGCAGSRFLNGTLGIHLELEEKLARFMGKEAAVTFSTGFQVNLGAIACLVERGDFVYLDKQDHACIIDGARLSFGITKKFAHNDAADLRRLMADGGRKGRLVVVDGVFSMEGVKSLGFDTGASETPVIPIIVGDDMRAFGMAKRLEDEGVFVNPVVSPATPKGRALLRTSYMATHTEEHLSRALEALEKVGREFHVI